MITAKEAKEKANWIKDIEKNIVKASAEGHYCTNTDLFYPDEMIEKYIIPFLAEHGYTCRVNNYSMMVIEGEMCSKIYISWENPIKKVETINE